MIHTPRLVNAMVVKDALSRVHHNILPNVQQVHNTNLVGGHGRGRGHEASLNHENVGTQSWNARDVSNVPMFISNG